MVAAYTVGCAVDPSDASELALETAAELARRLGAALVLVHVHEPLRAVADVEDPAAHDALASGAAELTARVAAWRAHAEALLGRPVRICVRGGRPAEGILRCAEAKGFDLLVVGTRGRRGLERLLLGSVADEVVRAAPCPVLVARPRLPGEGWDPAELAQYVG
jgi:nucleotide-binding universal stress UspA family protein